jgi:hypothetical protein
MYFSTVVGTHPARKINAAYGGIELKARWQY